jgi:hypothetical protein
MPNDGANTMNTYLGNEAGLDANKAVANLKYKVRTVDKTANYTCLPSDSGTHFTQSGGPVIFTLPTAVGNAGVEYWFASLAGANDDLVVTAPAGTLVAFNNITATSISLPTNALIIGSIIHVISNGTVWVSSVEVGNILAAIIVA